MTKKTETAARAELAKAAKEMEQFKQASRQQLEAMGTLHRFEMAGECTDLGGELTRVLEIDTDAEGILGLFMELGQPYSFVMDKDVAPEDRVRKDGAKFQRYLQAMANVDLSDKAVLKAVGWSALARAREVADGFFMLRLVCDTSLEVEAAG